MDVVTESSEANNLIGPVTVTVGLPDLLIPSMATTPSIPTQGTPFTISVQVANQSLVDADNSFQVDWYDDLITTPISTTVGTLSWHQQSLTSEATEILTGSYTFDQIGIHRFWTQVDRTNQVTENDETNNITGPSLFFVDRIEPTPTPLWTPTPQPTPIPTPTIGSISPTIYIQNDIISNTTWTAENVYVVLGQVTINTGVTLTVEPGTVIKFKENTYDGKLTVNGTLLAQGTVTNSIVFTSLHDDSYGGDTNVNGGATWPQAGDWDGLVFGNGSNNTLEHVWIGYGGADGNLTADGSTVNLHHAFVGYSASKGLRWKNGAGGEIINTIIEHNLSNGLHLTGSSDPDVVSNTIIHNRSYAVYMEGNCLPVFSNNTIYGNDYNAIGVYGNVGNTTWHADVPYIATQDLTINSGSTLTLEPGTAVKFFSGKNLMVQGSLIASGTITSPIVFTSIKDDEYGSDVRQDGGATKPSPGDWGTLYFADTSDDATTVLNHVVVRYGGAGYDYGTGISYANVTLDSASPRILNSFMEHSDRYGLQLINASSPIIDGNIIWENSGDGLHMGASSSPSVSDNALVRNNGYAIYVNGGSQAIFTGNVALGNRVNGIGVGGTINTDSTWGTNLPYVIDGNPTLAMNTTLTLQPGAVVKFPSGDGLTINGQLLAQGTGSHQIIFTSLRDDTAGGDTNNDAEATVPGGGDWEAITFGSTAGNSVLEYVTVRYGGSNSATGALYLDGSAPTLSHLVVMGSAYRGLCVQGASPLIENAVFAENRTGVYNGSSAYLIIQDSDVFSNTQYGLYNANTAYELNATDTWWGSADGPTHASNPGGTGDAVGDHVTYTPWATTSLASPLPTLPALSPSPGATEVSGNIAANTTWSLAESPYLVVGDVTVNAGVQLTIEPGVIIKFESGADLFINGILDAEGTADQHIVFTSHKDDSVGGDTNRDGAASWPAAGDWGRIVFNDSIIDGMTNLRYAEVRYGGSGGSAIYLDNASPAINDNTINENAGYGIYATNYANPSLQRNQILDNDNGGVRLAGTSAPTIVDNDIWGNGGYAVYMDATCYPTFSGNTAHYNENNGVRVNGTVSFNQTWHANLTYVIEGGLTIDSGPALTLEPGTVVKFKDPGSYLTVNGALVADGTADAPIVFTSFYDDAYGGDTDNDDGITWPAAGDWRRIQFTDASDDSQSVLDYVYVRYGGYDYNQSVLLDSAAPDITNSVIAYGRGDGLYLQNQANPLIQGSTFVQNTDSGLYLTSASAPTVQNNIFHRNQDYAVEMTADCKPTFSGNTTEDNAINGIGVSGTIAGSTTWEDDLTWVLKGDVTVPSDGSLTLDAGTVVKFLPGDMDVRVSGTFQTNGTAAEPVVLTSIKDDAYGGDTNNDDTATAPAAGDWGTGGLTFNSTATGCALQYTVVHYGGDPAIDVNSTSLDISNSQIDYNERALDYYDSTGTIMATQFLSNTEYAIYEDTSGLTIQDNEFRWNERGIYLRSATGSHALISRNAFEGNFKYSYWPDFDGFFLLESTNTFTNTVGNAVWVNSGDLTEDWTLFSGPVYRISSLDINNGATLTIEPGAILKFRSGGSALRVFGALLSQGTAADPVYFTSYKDDSVGGDTNGDGTVSSPAPGDWNTVYVSGGRSATFEYSILRYGGSSGTYDELAIIRGDDGATVNLNHSEVRDSGYYGIWMNDRTSAYTATLTLNNSIVADNSRYGIRMNADTNPAGYNNLIVTDSTISQNGDDGIWIDQPLTLSVTDTTFTSNDGYAMSVSFSNDLEYSQVDNNTASGNTHDAIYLSGDLIGASVLRSDIPYVISSLDVRSGATLTIEPGAILKFHGGGSDLRVYGTLHSQGTAGDPVYFTSYKDDSVGGDTNGDGSASTPAPGNWDSVYVAGWGSATFEYSILRYGGSSGTYDELAIIRGDDGATVNLNHSEVRDSGYYGIWMNDRTSAYTATLTLNNSIVADNSRYGIRMNADWNPAGYNNLIVTDSTISQNGDDGIWINRALNATIQNTNIYNNADYGVYNGTSDTSYAIDARYNWWGDASGPSPYGSGDAVASNVLVNPWFGSTTSTSYNSVPSVPWSAWEADPVNVIFGNYIHQHTDLAFPGRGLGFAFERTYNSNVSDDGPLGIGWTHAYNITATETIDGDVLVRRADGRLDHYALEDGAYTPPPGSHDQLSKTGSTFVLTQTDQTILNFSTLGYLSAMTDTNGNALTFTYSGSDLINVTLSDGRAVTLTYSGGHLTGLTDPAGRAISFGYTGDYLTSFTDTRGRVTTYAYDAQGLMESTTDANGHTFVHNTYDADGRVVEQRDAENNLTSFTYYTDTRQTVVTDPLGRTMTHTYDTAYRITSEEDPLGNVVAYQWDVDNNRTAVTDKRGNVTIYDYDDRGNVTVVTDALGYTRTFTYDAQNNPTHESDRLGHTTVYTYDANSNLIARQNALGNIAYWAYDMYGQVISQTDALSRTTSYAYDPYGHPTIITDVLGNATTFTYDIVGRKLSETNAKTHAITYTYNAANHVLTVSEPLGKVTFYAYDAVGNRTVITNPRGGVTTQVYDEKDRLIMVIDPLSHTTRYGYDVVDNQTVVTNALGHATRYGYDALNRRTMITDPLGNVTTYIYDPNGNRTSVTDANHNTTHYAYDALNRLISVTDAEGGTVIYDYDANGNRISIADANDHTKIYAYDALDRLVSATDPLTYTTVYTYDAVGNRVEKQKPDGAVILQSYDDLDRQVMISAPGLSINYAYDALGNRTAMTDATGVTTYTYNALNHLTQVTAPTGTLQYSYDLNGNRTHLIYPNGEVVTYTYDMANRLLEVTDDAARTTQYAYDAVDRQTIITYPNGIHATYTYDNADRLSNIIHNSPVSGTIAAFTYTLDAVGNRLAMTDTNGVTTYTYDSLYRLTEVTYPDSEHVTYAYDPMGNRTAMTSTISGVITYTYDANDRLLTAGSDIFGWDANGRMITRTYGANTAIYTYDSLDRLSQVVSGTITVAFTYNGDGVRVGKNSNGTLTDYVQDTVPNLPVVLQETTGSTSDIYIYGNGLTTRLSQSGDPVYYHNDGLGSVRALSNESGQRVKAYHYAAFGAIRAHSGNTKQPFQFIGEQTNATLGLMYLRARYYDPQIGRFVSSDYFPGFTKDPQSSNSYTYAQNNPVMYKDPEGEFIVTALAIGSVAYVGYKAVDAWKDFLDNSEQMEENLSGYYEFDFNDPEWQDKYADYNPGRDIAITARSGGYAALQTPGTSVTGQPPTSLDWTVPAEFVLGELLLPDFKKPSPNRIQPLNARRRYMTTNSPRSGSSSLTGYTNSSWHGASYSTWGSPPSAGK